MGTVATRIHAIARHLDRDAGGAQARPARQAVAGNGRPLRLPGDRALQPASPGVGGTDGRFELPAGSVVDAAMQMRPPAVGLQQRPSSAADAELTQADGMAALPEIAGAVEALAERGQPMPEAVRAFMEPRFCADFRAVRIHTDAGAHALARAVDAQAFTVGRDVVFGAGQFAPESDRGRHLIAHELTHVLQQAGTVAAESVQAPAGLRTPPRFGIERAIPPYSLQRQAAEKTPAKPPEIAAAAKTPLDQATALLQLSPATVKERADWILQAADQGFVSFNTRTARANLEGLREGDKVGDLDPKTAGYDVPILVVELGLAQTVVRRWVAAKGVGAKPSIEFGSMIRPAAGGGPHGKGKAIDINALRMATSVDATVLVLKDLDPTLHKAYGLGLPFQGEFFDKADELATKKAAAERNSATATAATAAAAAPPTVTGATGATNAGTAPVAKPAPATADPDKNPAQAPTSPLSIKDAVRKFESRLIESRATKTPDGKWAWTDATQDAEWNGAYKRLKSQPLKDALAERRKDGIRFDIFPDNDDHLHLDAR